ncbi:unnamed protein product [Penicillium glandicola]
MQLLWAILYMGSALASSIPYTNSHYLRLPFVPSPDDLENGVRSKLIYPPSVIMQLHAPLYEGANQINPSDKTVELSYTLESQTLPTNDMGSMADMIRVRVELFDLQGNLVSPHAVALDLLAYQNENYGIARIHVEPARSGDQDDHFSRNSQSWVIKYWTTQFGSIFDKSKTKATVPTHDSARVTEPSAQKGSGNATNSRSETHFFSFWATPADPNYHSRHDSHCSKDSFMHIARSLMLPILLGIIAGIVACLVGFIIGYLLMSLWVRLGSQWVLGHRSRIILVEEGTVSEKSPMMPLV